MAANLTITGLALGADGVTLTGTVTGGTGTGYGPGSGVTGLTVKLTTNGAPTVLQTSAGVSGTTLTIVLATWIPSTDTVTLDVSTGSNLTDSGANTAQGQTAAAVTNGSTKVATRFTASNAALTYHGRIGAVSGGNRNFSAVGTECAFAFTGTDLTGTILENPSNAWSISVDGSAFTALGTLAGANVRTLVRFGSGMAEGRHVFKLKKTGGASVAGQAFDASFLQGLGASPAIEALGTSDGYGPYLRAGAGTSGSDNQWVSTTTGNGYTSPALQRNTMPSGNLCTDNTFRFRASGSSSVIVAIWALASGAGYYLVCDNVFIEVIQLPNTSQYGWHYFTVPIDVSTEKVVWVANAGIHDATAQFDAVMLVGTGATFGTAALAPLPRIGGYGDSNIDASAASTITSNSNSSLGVISRLARAYNRTPITRGKYGSLVDGGLPAGEARTGDIIPPNPAMLYINYGTNDMGGGGNGSSPTAGFYDAVRIMLNAILAGSTSVVRYGGIRPRVGYTATTVANWNAPTGNGLQAAVASVITDTPAYASRLLYVPMEPIKYAGANSDDYTTYFQSDGLHPNAAGFRREFAYLAPWFADGAAFSVSGPSGGSVGVASGTFTFVLAGTGEFYSGVVTMNITGATLNVTAPGGVIVGNGTGSVQVTPADGQTGFTYTITPTSEGTKSVVYTNSQGWTNAANTTYEATAAPSSGIITTRRRLGLRLGF